MFFSITICGFCRFLVDNVPVREFIHSSIYPSIYPSKPMSVYATIWDGSEWATHGGKYPVNYKYAPFVVSFAQIQLSGCISDPSAPVSSCSKVNPSAQDPVNGPEFTKLSQQQVAAMDWARRKLMFYSYCNDRPRFKVMPPECHWYKFIHQNYVKRISENNLSVIMKEAIVVLYTSHITFFIPSW